MTYTLCTETSANFLRRPMRVYNTADNSEKGIDFSRGERVRELLMTRVMNQQLRQTQEESERPRDRNEVDEVRQEVNSRDKVKQIDKNDQLFVKRMVYRRTS